MSRLYRRLTIQDLSEGARIYGRMSAPYWIHILFGFVGVWAVLGVFEDGLPGSLERHLPGFTDRPWAAGVLTALAVAVLLIPLSVKLSGTVGRRLNSNETRAAYSLLSSVDRFNRWLSVFLAGIALYFVQRDRPDGNWVFVALIGVLAASLLISIALFGWLSRQFQDEPTFNHDHDSRSA